MRLRSILAIVVLYLGLASVPSDVASQTSHRLSGSEFQLFTVQSEHQMMLGDTLTIDVEMYITPESARRGVLLARAMNGMQFSDTLTSISLLHASLVQSRQAAYFDGTPVHVFVRRYSLIVNEVGTLIIPGLSFDFEGSTVYTRDITVQVAPPLNLFGDPEKTVFPIIAEIQSRTGNVRFRRFGSAFLVSDNAIVTSFHVILDAQKIELRVPSGNSIELDRLWTIDPVRDVAILFIDPRVVQSEEMIVLPMAPYTDATPEEMEFASTYSLGWRGRRQYPTVGTRHDRHPGLEWSTTNPVRPGDSGGPILDSSGSVLGVITSGTFGSSRDDVLQEEICMVADPRPAMRQIVFSKRTRLISSLFKDEAFNSHPYVRGQRLSSRLISPRGRGPVGTELESLHDDIHTLGQESFREDSVDVDLLFFAGFLEQLAGGGSTAVDLFQAVLDMNEDHYPSSYMLALHHLRRRKYVLAKQYFEMTARFEPFFHLAQYGIARSEMGLHHYGEASRLLNSVLVFDDSFAPALVDLGRVFLARNERVLAKQIYIRLFARNRAWSVRLRTMLENPILAPPVLEEIPRIHVAPLFLDH